MCHPLPRAELREVVGRDFGHDVADEVVSPGSVRSIAG
jgi:hypothetical protein